ncbi:hypothetical protein GW15_0204905 [Xanthomonas axonopodis pv. vasculorum]|uniref:Uncharacterized protein n=2 Tax=Xanthomonas axonopodis TaxID=53413 RepID=A0A098Q526_9XANT|nr:hypothetical protein GW15_0204905 [Xanthomonas axonopodis pv. vasculorum]
MQRVSIKPSHALPIKILAFQQQEISSEKKMIWSSQGSLFNAFIIRYNNSRQIKEWHLAGAIHFQTPSAVADHF